MLHLLNSDFDRWETIISDKMNMIKNKDYLNKVEIEELLEGKANKNSVASALQRKANKSDLENLNNQYVNFQEDLQNYNKFNEQLSSKLELIESKFAYLEIDSLKKIDRENLMESIEYKLDIST